MIWTYADSHDTYYYHNQLHKNDHPHPKNFLYSFVFLIFMVRTLNMKTTLLIYFEVHNTVLLTICAMLHTFLNLFTLHK